MIIKRCGGEIGVFADDELGGELVGDGVVNDVRCDGVGSELVRVEPFEVFDFVTGKNVAGAACLSADGAVSNNVPSSVTVAELWGVVFTVYYILYGSVVWDAKIDFFGAGGGDGEAGGASVGDFAGRDIINDDIEFNIFDGDFFVHFSGDFVDDFNIDADNFATFVVFKWGKKSVGFNNVIGLISVLRGNKS